MNTPKPILTPKDLAARLNGREIGNEITDAEELEAAAAGLVVLFGASDDLAEFRGAIDDEAYPGKEPMLVDAEGLLPERDQISHDDDAELEAFLARRKRPGIRKIKAVWSGKSGFDWAYTTDIPHETFEILEDGAWKYCRGIVFKLSDVNQNEPKGK